MTSSCSVCFTLKEFLKEHNIDFEEVDVFQSEKDKDEMIRKSHQMEVPTIEIDGQIVVNFDRKKICKLLNIHE